MRKKSNKKGQEGGLNFIGDEKKGNCIIYERGSIGNLKRTQ